MSRSYYIEDSEDDLMEEILDEMPYLDAERNARFLYHLTQARERILKEGLIPGKD